MKFFASYREAVGKEEIEINVIEKANISDLFDELKKILPKLGSLSETLIVSVNKEYASYDTILNEGDEVALLPPVSGG
ncbi:MAG: MoaD/ThiS family protein [Thermoplasmata archaeon]|nr:MAG: MoaD/ThiS family protein [Thermoplasmata archaeon]